MSEKKVNLRNKQQIKGLNIKPVEIKEAGLTGTLPFNSGLIAADRLDDLPKEVMDELQLMKEKAETIPEHIKQKAIPIPKPIDINSLPQEKIEELKKVIRDSAFGNKPKPIDDFVPSGPGVIEAIKLAEKSIKDREEKPVQMKEPVKEPEKQEESIKVETSGICQHCGWPTDKSDNTDPDIVDKRLFVSAILGQRRFTKEYGLFGGQFRVVFRTLTTEESDLVIKQLVKDWNDEKISGPAQSIAEATKYQLILSLDAIDTNVGLNRLPAFDEYEYDQDQIEEKGTILPFIVDYIYSDALKMEPLRRAVAKAYGHFLDTVSKLESMAENDSFWQATVD